MEDQNPPNPRTKKYDEQYKRSIPELAHSYAINGDRTDDGRLVRLVYEQKTLELQHEYVKKQIELQHQRNTELVEKQLRWVKFSAILTAIATLTAAIAGACLSYMLTRPLPQQMPKSGTPQTAQSRTESATSASHPEKTTDKVPFPSPAK